MPRNSNKDRDANEMVMGTFRIKSGIWEDFKRLASQNDVTATDLIISFIETCLQSQSIPQPQPLQDIPRSNLDDIYSYIDTKLDKLDIQSRQGIDTTNLDVIYTYIDNKLDKDIDDAAIKKQIAESLEDGAIGEKIDDCYQSMMVQLNELQSQIYTLKQELKSKIDNISEKSSISNDQSPITNDPSPITNDQSPITNPQSPVPNHQSPVTSPQSQITEPAQIERSHIENIRTTLKRKGVSAVTDQIRAAFFAAGFDGSNYHEIRKIVLEILS